MNPRLLAALAVAFAALAACSSPTIEPMPHNTSDDTRDEDDDAEAAPKKSESTKSKKAEAPPASTTKPATTTPKNLDAGAPPPDASAPPPTLTPPTNDGTLTPAAQARITEYLCSEACRWECVASCKLGFEEPDNECFDCSTSHFATDCDFQGNCSPKN